MPQNSWNKLWKFQKRSVPKKEIHFHNITLSTSKSQVFCSKDPKGAPVNKTSVSFTGLLNAVGLQHTLCYRLSLNNWGHIVKFMSSIFTYKLSISFQFVVEISIYKSLVSIWGRKADSFQ